MNAANGTALRTLTAPEEKAAALHQRGVPLGAIVNETGLSAEQITMAVGRKAEWDKLRGVVATKPSPAGTVEGYLTTNRLLAWAEGSGVARALALAVRIRSQLAELGELHKTHDARAKAQAEVDRLSAELEAAKAALREVGGHKADVRAAGTRPSLDRKQLLDAVRTWARDNGLDVSPLGRIPKNVQDAYDAAHRGAS